MKKLVLSILLSVLSCAPAFAGDDPATQTVLIPFRVAAFGVGTVVGTPVSIIKRSVKNVGKHTDGIASKMGGDDNTAAKVFAFPFALVTGTVAGTAEGVYYGAKNSVDNCAEHPFSAASMSLSDSDD